GEFDWLVFASVNAVTAFAERLAGHGLAWPHAPGYAAIGAKTAAALEERCGHDVLTPPDFRSESFLELPEMTAEKVAETDAPSTALATVVEFELDTKAYACFDDRTTLAERAAGVTDE
ncbi:MAG: uroporphyrinogen-III synthase, partial [Thiohalorhabdaceae bacterium]